MIKFNNKGNDTKAVKIGQNRGEKLPPGKYVLALDRAKSKLGENKALRTQGNLQVISEFTVVRILNGGEPYKNWDGNMLTAFEGVRRSNTLDLTKNEQATGQLNEMCLYLHGVNAKDPGALRELGVVAVTTKGMTRADEETEIIRASDEMDKVCNNVVDSVDNPLLGVYIECEVKDIVSTKMLPGGETQTRTFLAHNFGLCTDPADLAHNATILGA